MSNKIIYEEKTRKQMISELLDIEYSFLSRNELIEELSK